MVGEASAEHPAGLAGSVDRSVRAAQSAFEAGRGASPARRAGWLSAVAAAIEGAKAELVALAVEESGLPGGRLDGELTRTVFQLRFLGREAASGLPFGATIDHADPGWGMGPRPDVRRVGVPVGVVAVFGASNFPFAFSVLGGDTASALAAGCAVVHKAHPAHPRLARRTAEIAAGALAAVGAPAGLLALVEGVEAGTMLVAHPLVKAVGFTGSTQGGLALAAVAAGRAEPIPFYGELGSTNPVFVTPAAWAARRDDILQGYLGSVGLGMGQFCTKPGFLIVPDCNPAALRAALDRAPLPASHRMLTPAIHAAFDESLASMTAVDGVELLFAASSDGDGPPATLLAVPGSVVRENPSLLEREMFGPASVVVLAGSADEQIVIAGLIGGQLTATVHGERGEDVSVLVEALSRHAGRVIWNGWPTGVTVSYAQQHGGPFPATTAPAATSVGAAAIGRFLRPVAYQDMPEGSLPPALQSANPWGITRRVDGKVIVA
jgi:NADP-dependent aldehyde dehydrogenase